MEFIFKITICLSDLEEKRDKGDGADCSQNLIFQFGDGVYFKKFQFWDTHTIIYFILITRNLLSRRRYICFSMLARARNFCRVFYSFMLLHKNCLPTQKRFERLKPIEETFLLLTALQKNIYLLLQHTSASNHYMSI